MKTLAAFLLLAATLSAQNLPRIEKHDNRFALLVDGKPFLMLGAQLNNSSSWPATLPNAWEKLEAFHVNTVEAPVYWEQMEPTPGAFDFSTVDELLAGAREHHLHIVMLWFGTWKNGQNHYIPEWMKSDLKTYPREISAYGKVLDVMSPHSPANLDADKRAFTALMRHLKQADGTQHTVIMIQVENESGSIGSVRDFSPAAQHAFEQPVPAELTHALHLPSGNWSKVFGAEADERFGAYSIAHYINQVASAGKAEYPLPMYCNVWFAYPVRALENRDRPSPGQEYPSGGPQQANIPSGRQPHPPSTRSRLTSTPTTHTSSARSSPPTRVPTIPSSFPRSAPTRTSAASSSTRSAPAPSASHHLASTAAAQSAALPHPRPHAPTTPPTTSLCSTPSPASWLSSTSKASCRPPSKNAALSARLFISPVPMPFSLSASHKPMARILPARPTGRAAPSSPRLARSTSSSPASTPASPFATHPPTPAASSRSSALKKVPTSTAPGPRLAF